MLSRWLWRGELDDTYREFFIGEDATLSQDALAEVSLLSILPLSIYYTYYYHYIYHQQFTHTHTLTLTPLTTHHTNLLPPSRTSMRPTGSSASLCGRRTRPLCFDLWQRGPSLLASIFKCCGAAWRLVKVSVLCVLCVLCAVCCVLCVMCVLCDRDCVLLGSVCCVLCCAVLYAHPSPSPLPSYPPPAPLPSPTHPILKTVAWALPSACPQSKTSPTL